MKGHEKVKSPTRDELKHLVHSIGGEEKLQAILLDFYQEMSRDILIGYFFEGRDLAQIAKKQGEFILMAAGLIHEFKGKGPSTAHVALPPILTGHFDRRLVILNETLKRHLISESLISKWMSFEESFRSIVVK